MLTGCIVEHLICLLYSAVHTCNVKAHVTTSRTNTTHYSSHSYTHPACGLTRKQWWNFDLRYSKITSTESLSFCITTVSASVTNLTAPPTQSHDCSCYVSWPMLANPPPWLQPTRKLTNAGKSTALTAANTLTYAHTTSRILSTCEIGLGSLTLPAPEAGDFVESVHLYITF